MKAQPVGIGSGALGDRVHQPADGVVHAEVSVGLLGHAVGHLRAQHHPWTSLVGLELVERGLELPALVGRGQRARRPGPFGIENGGEEAIGRLLVTG